MRSFIIPVLALAALSVAACGGGGADAKVESTTTTVGQELIDLKRALDEGVINKSEYEDQKERILDR